MESDTIIKIENVSMRFNLSREKTDTIKEFLLRLAKRQLRFDEFYALRNVNLEIKRGESVALIGENGCGKSTLLKTIAGVYHPTEGTVRVNGSIAPLIELGAGFDEELTARENIFLNGAVLGFSHEFMENHFNEILDFADLWDFVDVPVKNYSSGMQARLGFSIATLVDADILVVDEILAVGDYRFQQKCHNRMNQMLSQGKTLLFVSHSETDVKRLCPKAVWLRSGLVQKVGHTDEVYEAYKNATAEV